MGGKKLSFGKSSFKIFIFPQFDSELKISANSVNFYERFPLKQKNLKMANIPVFMIDWDSNEQIYLKTFEKLPPIVVVLVVVVLVEVIVVVYEPSRHRHSVQ